MKKSYFQYFTLSLLFVLTLTLVGCGGSGSSSSALPTTSTPPSTNPNNGDAVFHHYTGTRNANNSHTYNIDLLTKLNNKSSLFFGVSFNHFVQQDATATKQGLQLQLTSYNRVIGINAGNRSPLEWVDISLSGFYNADVKWLELALVDGRITTAANFHKPVLPGVVKDVKGAMVGFTAVDANTVDVIIDITFVDGGNADPASIGLEGGNGYTGYAPVNFDSINTWGFATKRVNWRVGETLRLNSFTTLAGKRSWISFKPSSFYNSATDTCGAVRTSDGFVPIGANPVQVSVPTASPAGGTYTTAQNVTLSSITTGATIHYTVDGTTPTTSSATYSNIISITTNTTLKAIAVKNGLTDSAVMSDSYIFTSTPQTTTPTANPIGGSYNTSQLVTLNTVTSGATIHYTMDGTTPTTSSATYTVPITIASSLTLKAIAVKAGHTNSTVMSQAYTITMPFFPAGTVVDPNNVVAAYKSGSSLTIYCNLATVPGGDVSAPFLFGSPNGWGAKYDLTKIPGTTWASVTITVSDGQVVNFVFGGNKNLPNWSDSTGSYYWKIVGAEKYLSFLITATGVIKN
ncbi:MAG: chitobiase/beta-hexosaminidase C-terminal domain-containing protein [Candidatus Falkowbacteria bacterium]